MEPDRLAAWAWSLRLTPEEKLTLLALLAGEVEPTVPDLARRTGLGEVAVGAAIERLHRAGHLNDDFAPTPGTASRESDEANG